jgi:hypothetical protein
MSEHDRYQNNNYSPTMNEAEQEGAGLNLVLKDTSRG